MSGGKGPRSPVSDVPGVLDAARAAGIWEGSTRALVFHDLDRLEARIAELQSVFPGDTLHAVAVKANPIVALLDVVVSTGAGLEAASWEEVMLARAAGCPAERIVYDSPAKTDQELADALALGVWINADHEGELRRLEALGAPGRARIGLRVNPEVGDGAIAFTSTAGKGSKFGVPLSEAAALKRRFPFISGLHVHTGSQGCGLDLLGAAAQATAEVAEALNLDWLDVGGGLPVRYTRTDPEPPSLHAWAARLKHIEGWGHRRLVTELGRSLHAGCGWALSRIVGVKEVSGVPTIIVHLGADFLLRRVYSPDDWDHEFVVLDPQGIPRGGELRSHQIAGPLCFAGDLLARDRALPSAAAGDLLLIRDCGAYAVGLWSRHCNRGIPATWGYRGDALFPLHRGETSEDVVRFWSLDARDD
jgi:diaminopimelate decarboxylase